jgi:hypothetical protein
MGWSLNIFFLSVSVVDRLCFSLSLKKQNNKCRAKVGLGQKMSKAQADALAKQVANFGDIVEVLKKMPRELLVILRTMCVRLFLPFSALPSNKKTGI